MRLVTVLSAAVVAAAAAVSSGAAPASAVGAEVDVASAPATQHHHFETPKGAVVVTVSHAPPPKPAAAEESASEESSSASPPSEESSSAEESSAEQSQGAAATPDLSHYTLPPEPDAAKGYKSVSCPGDDPCSEQQQQQQDEGLTRAPCTENCEAEEAASNVAGGKVVYSQPLGDASGDNGYAAAPGSRVDSTAWTIVPQTGIDSSTAMGGLPSNLGGAGIAVGEPHPSAPGAACGCDTCPCKYETPAERRAQRLAQLEAQEKRERDAEKAKLHSTMQSHQTNLEKIEEMSRALRWQYTQLRRQHNLLRAHISANKAAYEEMGGDNEYRGTDLDIEATPNTYETLDDIPSANEVRVNDHAKDSIVKATEGHHARQKNMLSKLHSIVNQSVKDIAGDGSAPAKGASAAAAGRSAAEAAIAEAEAAK